MTPQELIDLPYAGMAEKELRKSKRWDENLGKMDVEWRVEVSYDIQVVESETDIVIVKARSKEEACDIACEELPQVIDGILDATIEILSVEEM